MVDKHNYILRGDKMIVQIKGHVKYPITLDPTVWIFDDRKIIFEELFNPEKQKERAKTKKQQPQSFANAKKPPVNQDHIDKNRKNLLKNSYAMPIAEFLSNAEVKEQVTSAIIQTKFGEKQISFNQLKDSFLHFSNKGKPLLEDGPVHLYFKDGSNRNEPIKGVQQIILST